MCSTNQNTITVFFFLSLSLLLGAERGREDTAQAVETSLKVLFEEHPGGKNKKQKEEKEDKKKEIREATSPQNSQRTILSPFLGLLGSKLQGLLTIRLESKRFFLILSLFLVV